MRFQGLDLNLLVALDALLAERSVSGASARLNLSQPAVSGMLKRLRDYFGDELLAPAGRRLVLTPRAEALRGPVRDVLLDLETRITRPPQLHPAGMRREVSVIASDYTIAVLLGPALSWFAEAAPGLTFALRPMDQFAPERLARGEADLLIIAQDRALPDQPSRILHQDDYVAAAWAGNDAVGDTLTAAQYMDMGHVAVQLGPTPFMDLELWLRQTQGRPRRIEATAPSFLSQPGLVVGNRRLATVRRRLAELYARLYPLKLLPMPFELPPLREVVQWHAARAADPGLQWIVERLVAFAEGDQDSEAP